MIKAVLFDMDGLLADTENLNIGVAVNICKEFGISLNSQERQNCIGITNKKFYRELFKKKKLNLDIQAVLNLHYQFYEKALLVRAKPFPAARQLPLKLKAYGYKLGMVSGSTKRQIDIVLKKLGLKQIFDVIISADDIKNSKPDPEGYLLVARRLHLNPKECVVLEDSATGVTAAKKAGMEVIGVVNNGGQDLSQASIVIKKLTKIEFKPLKFSGKTYIYEGLAGMFGLWRQTTLERKNHEQREAKFIIKILKKYGKNIKTVIDLGGGIGLHANLLKKAGYYVTLFDQSEKALAIAKKNYPGLKIVKGSFENIKIKGEYDAAICMWSTLSYVISGEGRKNFYNWQNSHIKKLIILDEANFYKYPKKFGKLYFSENKDFSMKVVRDWVIAASNTRKTQFTYEIYNKKNGEVKIVDDAEVQQYLPITKQKRYLGATWILNNIYGDYNLKNFYNKKKSPRILSVFGRV
jgi:HAD superfamily hydrolase (TIGR01509 family)